MPPAKPQTAAKPSRLRRAALALCVVLFLAFVGVRFLVLPAVLRSDTVRGRVRTTVEAALGCKVDIGTVRPRGVMGLEYSLDILRIRNPAGFSDTEMVRAESVYLAPGWLSLLSRQVVIHDLRVEELRVRVERSATGDFNLLQLAGPTAVGQVGRCCAGPRGAGPPTGAAIAAMGGIVPGILLQANTVPAAPFPLRIARIRARVLKAEVNLAAPGAGTVTLANLRADASLSGPDAPLEFLVETAESKTPAPALRLQGKARVVQDGQILPLPPTTEFDAQAKNVDVAPMAAFLGLDDLPVVLTRADIAAKGRYDAESGALQAQVTADCGIHLGISLPAWLSFGGKVRAEEEITLVKDECRLKGTAFVRDAGLRIAFVLPVTIGSVEVPHDLVCRLDGSSVEVKELQVKPGDDSFPLSLECGGTASLEKLELDLRGTVDLSKVDQYFGPWMRLANPALKLEGGASFRVQLIGSPSSPGVDGNADLAKAGGVLGPWLRKIVGDRLYAMGYGSNSGLGFSLMGDIGEEGSYSVHLDRNGLCEEGTTHVTLTVHLLKRKRRVPFPGGSGIGLSGRAFLMAKGELSGLPASLAHILAGSTLSGILVCGPSQLDGLAGAPVLDRLLRGAAVRILCQAVPLETFDLEFAKMPFSTNKGRLEIPELHLDGKALDVRGKGTCSLLSDKLDLELSIKPEKELLEGAPAAVRDALAQEPDGVRCTVTGTFDNPKVEYQPVSQAWRDIIRKAQEAEEAQPAPSTPPEPAAP